VYRGNYVRASLGASATGSGTLIITTGAVTSAGKGSETSGYGICAVQKGSGNTHVNSTGTVSPSTHDGITVRGGGYAQIVGNGQVRLIESGVSDLLKVDIAPAIEDGDLLTVRDNVRVYGNIDVNVVNTSRLRHLYRDRPEPARRISGPLCGRHPIAW
jgi:hypothetical protein